MRKEKRPFDAAQGREKRKETVHLFLDPRAEKEIMVGLWNGKSAPRFFIYKRDQMSLLERIEKKLSSQFSVLSSIFIIPGPGGFSNVRGAVVLANALGFALDIPVVSVRPGAGETSLQTFRRVVRSTQGKRRFAPITPIYGREPNITRPSVNSK